MVKMVRGGGWRGREGFIFDVVVVVVAGFLGSKKTSTRYHKQHVLG